MSNIKFDNPWLLIVGLPLLLITIISFIISIKRDNRTKNNTISYIIHIVICVLITLAFAKTSYEKVITETEIYVLADVSYSANKDLDKIDEYINNLKGNVPKNSKIGVIAFAKDYELLVEPGKKLKSIKEANVDNSATNIVEAFEYAESLFKDNVVKRIVLISDGEETKESNIISVVQGLIADDIYIDAIYLDSNLKENEKEIQINSIEYSESIFKGTEESAYAVIQSSYDDAKAILNLTLNGEKYISKAITLQQGYNAFTFELDTELVGINKYELSLNIEGEDGTLENNRYLFTQTVTEKVKMLFISGDSGDRVRAQELYGDRCDIDFYIEKKDVPFTVEDLCVYDEFVLSNIDIRDLDNPSQFISSIEVMVSEFGKSLITFGNLYVQNNPDDPVLSPLNDILPVKYGKPEQKDKLVTILLDISRSMEYYGKGIIAKKAACQILDNLDDEVNVFVAAFFGEVATVLNVTPASNREAIKKAIMDLDEKQGTFLGSGIEYVYNTIKDLPYSKNQVILLSDGLNYSDADDLEMKKAIDTANLMREAGIGLSTILTSPKTAGNPEFMRELADICDGYSYAIEDEKDVSALILDDVLNELNEIMLEGQDMPINILAENDPLIKGIDSLPNILGLINNTKKPSAKTVIEAEYIDASKDVHHVPLYSYWDYGNGKVSSFASTFTGDWVQTWGNNAKANKVLSNVLPTNQPKERIGSAFIVSVEQKGTIADIIVKVPLFNQKAKLMMKVTQPDKTFYEIELIFDTENYVATIDTSFAGEYLFEIYYTFGDMNYKREYIYNLSYLPEYDEFTKYDISNLYYMVGINAQISSDGNLVLENDNSIIRKYILDFVPICMILSVILFVLDVAIRKLRWQDIKNLFKKQGKRRA